MSTIHIDDAKPLWAKISLAISIACAAICFAMSSFVRNGMNTGRVPVEIQAREFAKSSAEFVAVSSGMLSDIWLQTTISATGALVFGVIALVGYSKAPRITKRK